MANAALTRAEQALALGQNHDDFRAKRLLSAVVGFRKRDEGVDILSLRHEGGDEAENRFIGCCLIVWRQ